LPAPNPTPSGVIKVSFTHGNGSFSLKFAYSGSTPSAGDLTTLAGVISTAYAGTLAGLLASEFALIKTEVLDLANPGHPAGINETVVDGTRSGTPAPNQVAALMDFTIGRRYRGSKPKAFMPFGVESDFATPIQWTTDFATEVDSTFGNFVDDIGGTTFGGSTVGTQVSVSYFDGKTVNPNPSSSRRFVPTPRGTPVVDPVLNAQLRVLFGSQRRRR
jgi:hypothetical protein